VSRERRRSWICDKRESTVFWAFGLGPGFG
jgi:hypothetical protein